jgi:pyruvate ferredoxin oxidoreductase gamma subunit
LIDLKAGARGAGMLGRMLEIVIQGRGGQGAQLAGTLLARAFFAEGREVQSFATYGGARRGTPVSAFIRVDEQPIRLRCDIEQADAVLCFDASLLEGKLLATAGPRTLIVVNSRKAPEHFGQALPGYRVAPVDALEVASRHGLGRMVNSALLGALACAVGAPSLETLTTTIAAEAPKNGRENAAACVEGWRRIEAQLARAAA